MCVCPCEYMYVFLANVFISENMEPMPCYDLHYAKHMKDKAVNLRKQLFVQPYTF